MDLRPEYPKLFVIWRRLKLVLLSSIRMPVQYESIVQRNILLKFYSKRSRNHELLFDKSKQPKLLKPKPWATQ